MVTWYKKICSCNFQNKGRRTTVTNLLGIQTGTHFYICFKKMMWTFVIKSVIVFRIAVWTKPLYLTINYVWLRMIMENLSLICPTSSHPLRLWKKHASIELICSASNSWKKDWKLSQQQSDMNKWCVSRDTEAFFRSWFPQPQSQRPPTVFLVFFCTNIYPFHRECSH